MKQNKEYKSLKKWLQMDRHHVNNRKQLNEATPDGTIKHVVFDADGFKIEVKTGLVKSYCEAEYYEYWICCQVCNNRISVEDPNRIKDKSFLDRFKEL